MRILLFLLPVALLIAQPTAPPVENEYVRVVMANDRPGVKPGALHEHKQNRVMIYLDSGDIQLKYADGHVENQHWKAGDIAWSPASGMHTSQNVSAEPVRIVEIELRNTSSNKKLACGGTPVLDNPQVTVCRSPAPPPAGVNFVAVNEKTSTVAWNRLPEGAGPFVIVEIK